MQGHIVSIVKLCGETAMSRIRVALMFLGLVLVTAPSFAQGSETVVYFHADAIGSTRLVTDANGAVVERYDYLPFGEPYPPSAPVLETRRFGGKERDTETGLDYFGGRYYASGNGRFIVVDPVLDIESALVDPQGWNRYVYAGNNPFKYVDPDGRNKLLQWLANPQVQRMLIERAERFVTAAANTARAGYVWATGFFNSPTGHEATIAAAEAITGAQLPSVASTFGFARVEGIIDGFTFGRLANGAEVAARFSRAGDTLTTAVLGAFNPEGTKAAGTLGAILEGAQAVAKGQGAKQLVIQAVGVVNPRLANLLVKQGFKRTTIKVGEEFIDAYEKAFEVY